MARRAWWSRTRGLPTATHASWLSSMRAVPERPTRVLAWAEATDGYVIGSAAVLSASGSTSSIARPEGEDWRHVGWHEIERGGWNAETRRLTWAEYGGRRGSLELIGPGRLPELFRERVAASIVVERFVAVSGERGVVVNGRRDLAAASPVIAGHATLGRGLSWRTPGLREAVDAAMAELQAEYDPGPV
jgi:hypothetical protein